MMRSALFRTSLLLSTLAFAGAPALAREATSGCLEYEDILYCADSPTTRIELVEGRIEVSTEPDLPVRVTTESTVPAAVWNTTFTREDELLEDLFLDLEIHGGSVDADRETLARIGASKNNGLLTLTTDLGPMEAETATVEYLRAGESLGTGELPAEGFLGMGRLYTDVEMSGDALVYRFADGPFTLLDGHTVDELRITLTGQRRIDYISGSSWATTADRRADMSHLTEFQMACPGNRYDWLEHFGGAELDSAKSVVTQIWGARDAGSLGAYVAGQVHPDHDAHFGTVTLNASLASFDDLIVSQVDECGDWKWARRGVVSGDSAEMVDITLTPQGHPVAVGHFSGTVTFDEGAHPHNPGQNVLTTTGSEIFLVSYERDGDLRWVRQYVPPGGVPRRANAITVADDGTLYVVGDAGNDGFLALFDTSGQPVTDSLIDGLTSVDAHGVAVTFGGGICIAGSFRGWASFDGIWRNAQTTADGFLAYYRLTSGSLGAVAVETQGGTGAVSFNAVAAGWIGSMRPCDVWYGPNGEILGPCPTPTPWLPQTYDTVQTYCAVVGDFDQQVTFQDPFGWGSDTLTATDQDVFVTTYALNPFSSLMPITPPSSAAQIGGTFTDHGADISIANRNRGPISVTGWFDGEVKVGAHVSSHSFTNSTTTLESLAHQVFQQADRDVFTVQYNTFLDLLSAGRAGGLEDDEGLGVSSRSRRTDVFTAGGLESTVNSDLRGKNPLVTTSHGDRDGLLGKNTPSEKP